MKVDSGHVPTDGARLYYRMTGEGRPIVVLHGGPDLDHTYLLPELDRLADSCRLVYYDQRGRGRSAEQVRPEDVSLESEIDDLDSVRDHFGLDSFAVLGHSWGGVLAMEYATRHPERVSHLILLNTAPASADDAASFREHLLRVRPTADVERMRELAASAPYQAGDLDVEAEYIRIHYRAALRDPEQIERVLGRLRTHFTEASVLTARAIEQRLYERTWGSDGYDLVPRLAALDIPTLVIHGEDDFVPVALAARIAEAIPRARLAVLQAVGHFAYLEAPDAVRRHVRDLLES